MRKSVTSILSALLAGFILFSDAFVSQAAKTSPFFNVADYGAVGDGKILCTEAIQKTVDMCAAAGGGTVNFPAGKYLSGAIFLKSNVTLHIGEGATLLASTNFEDFPPFKPRWSILSDDTKRSSLITGIDIRNCKNIELNGIKTTKPLADEPVVRMENVQNAFIHGCRAFPGTESFLELKGKTTKGILLVGNQLTAAKNSFVLKNGDQKRAVVEK